MILYLQEKMDIRFLVLTVGVTEMMAVWIFILCSVTCVFWFTRCKNSWEAYVKKNSEKWQWKLVGSAWQVICVHKPICSVVHGQEKNGFACHLASLPVSSLVTWNWSQRKGLTEIYQNDLYAHLVVLWNMSFRCVCTSGKISGLGTVVKGNTVADT